MHLEIEQKFAVADRPALLARMQAVGAMFDDGVEQIDEYFAHPCRDFAQTDEALRIRSIGDVNCITYKGPKLDAQTKTRRELELTVLSGEAGRSQFAELLSVLGFRSVARVRKHRRTATLKRNDFEITLALDEVDGIGCFVELETIADTAELDPARLAIGQLGSELSLVNSERRSYLELLLAGREIQSGSK